MKIKMNYEEDRFAVADCLAIKLCIETGKFKESDVSTLRKTQKRITALEDDDNFNKRFSLLNAQAANTKTLAAFKFTKEETTLYNKHDTFLRIIWKPVMCLGEEICHAAVFMDGENSLGIVRWAYQTIGLYDGFTENTLIVFASLLATNSISEMARLTDLSKSTISENLGKLIDYGLAAKKGNKYELSESGKEYMAYASMYYPG